MSSMTFLRWGLIAVFGFMLIGSIVSLIRDLLFYSRNGWDFTQDSGEKVVFSDESGIKPGWVLPNRARVTSHSPVSILCFAAIICVVYLIPESWFEEL